MKEFWGWIQVVFAAVGGWAGYFVGGADEMFYALLILVVCDYITGVLCAIADRKLSSDVGFKGICRKVLIFIMVGIANVIDVNVLGEPGVLRTAVIFFYISNEGLSLIENSAYLGLPVPESMKRVLEQLHNRAEKEGIELKKEENADTAGHGADPAGDDATGRKDSADMNDEKEDHEDDERH